MLEIRIEDEELARKLRERAEQEQRAVDEIASELLADAVSEADDPEFYGSGAHLAQIAIRANIRTENPIDVTRADEILEEIYEERLKRREQERERGEASRPD